MYNINTYFTALYLRCHNVMQLHNISATLCERCIRFVYDTTLPQLRCKVVVTLCVSWESSNLREIY